MFLMNTIILTICMEDAITEKIRKNIDIGFQFKQDL